jgi:hypothetical protein
MQGLLDRSRVNTLRLLDDLRGLISAVESGTFVDLSLEQVADTKDSKRIMRPCSKRMPRA